MEVYDKPQRKSLQRIDSFSEEELEHIAFKVDCKCEGIDPEHPNAPKMLKKIKRRNKWKYEIWPTIRNTSCWILGLYCAFNSGYYLANGMHWGWSVFHMLGAVGWLNVFLTYKFGPNYIFKH